MYSTPPETSGSMRFADSTNRPFIYAVGKDRIVNQAEIAERVVELVTQADFCSRRCDERHGISSSILEAHSNRISALEAARWQILAICAGSSLVGGVLTTIVTEYITKKL